MGSNSIWDSDFFLSLHFSLHLNMIITLQSIFLGRGPQFESAAPWYISFFVNFLSFVFLFSFSDTVIISLHILEALKT